MRHTNQTTARTLHGEGVAFTEYFPRLVSDELSWSVACSPRCDAKVPAAGWAAYNLTDQDGAWKERTMSAYAEVTTTTAVTHVTISLVSWDIIADGLLAYAVIAGVYGLAVAVAMFIAAVGILLICTFCWGRDARKGELVPLLPTD